MDRRTRFLSVVLGAGFLMLSFPAFAPAADELREKDKKFVHGPLKITADMTVSKEKGKLIEGEGRVTVSYETESGDIFRSFSRFARYSEKDGLGEIWGQPRASWKRPDGSQPETRLWAEQIILDLNAARLTARGKVIVHQASSTLKADQVDYYNIDKKMTAQGGRPLFILRQPDQIIRISAEKILALTERKQIQFEDRVQGLVEFAGRTGTAER